MEEKKGNGCNQLAIVLKYKDFKTNYGEPEEIHSVTRWCKVEEVGQSNLFFDTKNVDGREGSFVSESGATLEVSAIMEQTYTRWFNEGDIISLEGQVDINDDNAPVPENIPAPSNDSGNKKSYSWGYHRVYQFCQVGGQKKSFLNKEVGAVDAIKGQLDWNTLSERA